MCRRTVTHTSLTHTAAHHGEQTCTGERTTTTPMKGGIFVSNHPWPEMRFSKHNTSGHFILGMLRNVTLQKAPTPRSQAKGKRIEVNSSYRLLFYLAVQPQKTAASPSSRWTSAQIISRGANLVWHLHVWRAEEVGHKNPREICQKRRVCTIYQRADLIFGKGVTPRDYCGMWRMEPRPQPASASSPSLGVTPASQQEAGSAVTGCRALLSNSEQKVQCSCFHTSLSCDFLRWPYFNH